jgi:hypothetical protein
MLISRHRSQCLTIGWTTGRDRKFLLATNSEKNSGSHSFSILGSKGGRSVILISRLFVLPRFRRVELYLNVSALQCLANVNFTTFNMMKEILRSIYFSERNHEVTKQLIDSLENGPYREADSHSSSQKISNLLWKRNFHYRVHRTPLQREFSPPHTVQDPSTERVQSTAHSPALLYRERSVHRTQSHPTHFHFCIFLPSITR